MAAGQQTASYFLALATDIVDAIKNDCLVPTFLVGGCVSCFAK